MTHDKRGKILKYSKQSKFLFFMDKIPKQDKNQKRRSSLLEVLD